MNGDWSDTHPKSPSLSRNTRTPQSTQHPPAGSIVPPTQDQSPRKPPAGTDRALTNRLRSGGGVRKCFRKTTDGTPTGFGASED